MRRCELETKGRGGKLDGIRQDFGRLEIHSWSR